MLRCWNVEFWNLDRMDFGLGMWIAGFRISGFGICNSWLCILALVMMMAMVRRIN